MVHWHWDWKTWSMIKRESSWLKVLKFQSTSTLVTNPMALPLFIVLAIFSSPNIPFHPFSLLPWSSFGSKVLAFNFSMSTRARPSPLATASMGFSWPSENLAAPGSTDKTRVEMQRFRWHPVFMTFKFIIMKQLCLSIAHLQVSSDTKACLGGIVGWSYAGLTLTLRGPLRGFHLHWLEISPWNLDPINGSFLILPLSDLTRETLRSILSNKKAYAGLRRPEFSLRRTSLWQGSYITRSLGFLTLLIWWQ